MVIGVGEVVELKYVVDKKVQGESRISWNWVNRKLTWS